VDTSPGIETLQRIFDQVLPAKGDAKSTTPPPAAAEPVVAPTTPAAAAPETVSPPAAAEEPRLPSFLEEALKPEVAVKPPAPQEPEVEWSDELPQEERRSRIKGLRDAYKKVKGDLEDLRKRPASDPQQTQRLAYLEEQNRNMSGMLTRLGVEHSAEFQQGIIAPLTAHWNEAAKIVRDAGGDPQELAKAMSLQGRSQFEALDTLFSELPESAKAEAHDALRNYRRYEEARKVALQNAPRTLEQIRRSETERQYQEVNKQRGEMQTMFDNALAALRDQAKVEIFQETTDPDGKWWNDQKTQVIEQARSLFLENTDMNKLVFACLLAPTADAYRKLFIRSQKKIGELQKVIKDRLGGEPNLSESGGNAGNLMPDAQLKEDLKRPFNEIFLREFHKAQAKNR
jgi:hypothetical protein